MTDYSDSEIKRMRGYRHTADSPRGELFVSEIKHDDIPTYYNWRLRGNYGVPPRPSELNNYALY